MSNEYRQLCSLNKTKDIHSDLAKHFETRHDTSNYELNRPLSKRKNKKSSSINKR